MVSWALFPKLSYSSTTEMAPMTTEPETKLAENKLGLKRRAGLLLAAYGVTLLILISRVEGLLAFPVGLFYLLLGRLEYFHFIEIGWGLYLVLTLALLLTRRKNIFNLLYALLVMLLICNIGGCLAMSG